ncbi:MAG: phosphonate ABC transporter, permease protein PhnE [Trueperaceae bacterium]|jgi:phosphonate ABC transporter permease subunit PhnE|nr:phosphonate ABC transporter, permease protein PhnE [Truepera sp.]
MWASVVIGAGVSVLIGLARASMRRLVITAGLALLVAYLAFPFSTAVGFVSRNSVRPTLLGMTPFQPLLAVVLIAALAAIIVPLLNARIGGLVAVLGAAGSLVTVLTWHSQAPALVKLLPLNGLMEVLTGAVLFVAIAFAGWGSGRLRWPVLGLAAVAGVLTAALLLSPGGQRVFPNAVGYYRLTTPASAEKQHEIVEEYNANLETTNSQRQKIGLKPLPAIESAAGLATERLPEAAANAGYRMLRPAESGYGVGVVLLLCGVLLGSGLMLLAKPALKNSNDLATAALYAGALVVLAPAFASTEFGFRKLVEGWPFLLNFLDRAWPPLLADPTFGQFGIFPLQEVASQMLITLEIALVGTFLGALFAVPLSFPAARNLTARNPLMRAAFVLTRGFFNLDRGIDTLILALIFVATVGLGPLAGVLAMAIHSIADLGKLYSESIENVDKGPIEALEAVGGSGSNVVRWAILPQVSPLFLGWTLYRFEINFRVSIVLGLVGAGGIGFFIQDKMASGKYDQMILAIIAIVIVVNIIDFVSSWLRGKLV